MYATKSQSLKMRISSSQNYAFNHSGGGLDLALQLIQSAQKILSTLSLYTPCVNIMHGSLLCRRKIDTQYTFFFHKYIGSKNYV